MVRAATTTSGASSGLITVVVNVKRLMASIRIFTSALFGKLGEVPEILVDGFTISCAEAWRRMSEKA